MTSLMMHHVHDDESALKEMVRVLKDDGMLVIADIAAGRFKARLEQLGLTMVESRLATRLFFMPVKIVIAKK